MPADLTLRTLIGESWPDYALLDSGDGRKLERYGRHRFIRPEAQALWPPATADWQADAEFVPGADEDGGGRWRFDRPVPRDGWPLAWDDVRFTAQATPFRHLGFFPDMAPVWTWMRAQLAGAAQPDVLNLFGYTGVGSLALASSGARVTHVDASKKSVEAARANAALSGLTQAPVRWLVDDATKFIAREGRRGRRYDGILLDPPKFGRGPDGEVWLPPAARRRQPLPLPHRLRRPHERARDRRDAPPGVGGPAGNGGGRRAGRTRGSARAGAAHRDLGALVARRLTRCARSSSSPCRTSS